MITEYQIKNFKCFADTGKVQLGALTVLLGRNNSGKSSFIQPLQMLAQTFVSDDPAIPLAMHEPHDFGGYFEWVHRGQVNREFRCAFTIDQVELAGVSRASRPEEQRHYRLSLALTFGLKQRAKGQSLHLREFQLRLTQLQLSGSTRSDAMEWVVHLNHLRKPVTATFNREKIDASGLEMIHCLPATLKWEKPVSLFVSDYAVVQPPHYFYSMDMPVREALDIAMVEPMRPPIPRVLRSNERSPRVGGSTTNVLAGLLRARTRTPKKWSEFKHYVNRWFGDVAECFTDFDIEVIDEGRELFALVGRDCKTGARVNLADMGFGVAQAFPIFVRLFYSWEGQIIVIEEPELHLNPAAQGMIFDAVAEYATQGRQIIVETHSEHFVLRMRRRSLERPELRDLIRVHYVERREDQSVLTELPMTEDGRLDNWPAGFLNEAFEESIKLMKQLDKRSASEAE